MDLKEFMVLLDTLLNGDQSEKIEFAFLILDGEDKQRMSIQDFRMSLERLLS